MSYSHPRRAFRLVHTNGARGGRVLFLAVCLLAPALSATAQIDKYLQQFPTPQQVRDFLKGSDAVDTAFKQHAAGIQLQRMMLYLSYSQDGSEDPKAAQTKRAYQDLQILAFEPIKDKMSGPDREVWYKLLNCYITDTFLLDDVLQHFLKPDARNWAYTASKMPMPTGQRPVCPSELPSGTVLPTQLPGAIPADVISQFPPIEQVLEFVKGETPLDTKLKQAGALSQLAALIYHLNQAVDQNSNSTTFVGGDLQSKYTARSNELAHDPRLVSTVDTYGIAGRLSVLYKSDSWFRDELMRKFFKPQAVEWMYATLKQRPPTGERLVWATTGPQPGPPDPTVLSAKANKLNALFNGLIKLDEPLDLPVCPGPLSFSERMAGRTPPPPKNCVKFPDTLSSIDYLNSVYSKVFYIPRLIPKGDGYPKFPMLERGELQVDLLESHRPTWMKGNTITVHLHEGRVVGVYIPTGGLYAMKSANEELIAKYGRGIGVTSGTVTGGKDNAESYKYEVPAWSLGSYGLHVEHQPFVEDEAGKISSVDVGRVWIETASHHKRRTEAAKKRVL